MSILTFLNFILGTRGLGQFPIRRVFGCLLVGTLISLAIYFNMLSTRSFVDITREVMNQNRVGEVTIITTANFELRYIVQKWMRSLASHNYKRFVVFCLDSDMHVFMISQNYTKNAILVPNEWLDSKYTIGFNQWKSNIWYHLLSLGKHFIYSDPSVEWMSDHVLEHLDHQYKNSMADVIFSQDLSDREILCNTRFFYARATDFAKNLFLQMINEQLKGGSDYPIHEQIALHNVLSSRNFNDRRVDTLDLMLYANREVYFDQNMNNLNEVKPLVILHKHTELSKSDEMNRLKQR
jgi:hypothetical protein